MEYKDEALKNPPYVPSEKELEVVNRVFERFTAMKDERDNERHEFGGKTLTQYVNDSMDAYNGIVSDQIKATKEDWQSLIWDHETRGKIKTLVAMVASSKPFLSLVGVNEEAEKYSSDMFYVYEDSWKKENGSYKLYLQLLSAACKGTVIVEEQYVEEKQLIKQISSINQETGQVKFKEKEIIKGGAGQVRAEIVPLLQFYPNENSPEIKHDCCVVRSYTKKVFKNKFGKYPNADKVVNGLWASDWDNCNYKSIAQNQSELIECIFYYNEDWDEYIILANGVWLNKQDKDGICPIPFDHHRLPFTKTVFELADEECFYGKSFPDLLSGEQETRNALLRLMIDQEILAVNKPFVLGQGSEIDNFQLYPGAIKKLTGDVNQFKELDISGSSQSAFSLLSLLKNSSDVNSSIDPTAQGVHSGRKTAREAVILDENAKRVSSTFHFFIYKLLKDRAELRISNIKQFYTKPIQYSVLKDKYGNPILNEEGKTTKTIPEYRKVTISEPGKTPFWVKMNKDMKNCNWEIRLVEDFEVENSRSLRIELASSLKEEAKVNPLIDADEATIDWLVSIGKNPDKFYLKPTPEAQQFQMEQGLPPKNPQIQQ